MKRQQRSSDVAREAWRHFCGQRTAGVRDPAKLDGQVLCDFLAALAQGLPRAEATEATPRRVRSACPCLKGEQLELWMPESEAGEHMPRSGLRPSFCKENAMSRSRNGSQKASRGMFESCGAEMAGCEGTIPNTWVSVSLVRNAEASVMRDVVNANCRFENQLRSQRYGRLKHS